VAGVVTGVVGCVLKIATIHKNHFLFKNDDLAQRAETLLGSVAVGRGFEPHFSPLNINMYMPVFQIFGSEIINFAQMFQNTGPTL
jgi:hypothetical protein